MDSLTQKVAARAKVAAGAYSTPAEWELGGEVLDQGMDHAAFKRIKDAWKEVEEGLARAQKSSASGKKFGLGRTTDPDLIGAHVLPALLEYASEVQTIAKQLKERLGV
jgi:hypothetical protein